MMPPMTSAVDEEMKQIDHDLNGNIIVLDNSACCVMVYNPNVEFTRQISNEGDGPGELRLPMSVTVVVDGRIRVRRGTVFDVYDFNG